ADTTTLKDHVANHIENYNETPETLTADAGYGSEENYTDLEAVFGNIKHNMNFKRFMLRGIDKVNVEIGLVAMAHNLKKYSLAL
ncbi:transposase, partial [Sabulilitoribacter arenilitoris]